MSRTSKSIDINSFQLHCGLCKVKMNGCGITRTSDLLGFDLNLNSSGEFLLSKNLSTDVRNCSLLKNYSFGLPINFSITLKMMTCTFVIFTEGY